MHPITALKSTQPRRIAALAVAFAALALAAGPAHPPIDRLGADIHYGPWHSGNLYGGGYCQNVVLCPSDPHRAYTYVDMAGLYCSKDGGFDWRMLQGNLPQHRNAFEVRGLSVDPRDADRFLSAHGGYTEGVFSTDDGGEHFALVLTAQFVGNGDCRECGDVLLREPTRPDVVWAGSVGTGIFRSDDNGKAWVDLGLHHLWISGITLDRFDPNRAWVCAHEHAGMAGGSGFYRSDDNGRTWQKLSEHPPMRVIQDPRGPHRLYAIFDSATVQTSGDEGATWTLFSNGLPVDADHSQKKEYTGEHRFNALAAGPAFLLTASANGTFYRLNLGEDHWQKIQRVSLNVNNWWGNGPEHFGKALSNIVIDPRNSNHWFMTDWFALWQTFDAGKNWVLTIHGFAPTYIHTVLANPVDPRIVFLGMSDNGYFRSDDAGESFWHVGKGLTADIKDIDLCRDEPQNLYALGCSPKDNGAWVANQVFVSHDSGLNWSTCAQHGLPNPDTHRWNSVCIDRHNRQLLYLAVSGELAPDDGGPYVSSDGGASWRWFGEGLPAGDHYFRSEIWSYGREIAVDSAGNLVCVSDDNRFCHYFDRGASRWQAASLRLTAHASALAADLTHPGRFLLSVHHHGVYISEDAGRTWHQTYSGDTGRIGLDAVKSGRMAVSTADGVILSVDGGQTWRMLNRSLPDRISQNMATFSGDRLIVGSGASGVFWLDLNGAGVFEK